MNIVTTFYVVRHGETEWNLTGRIQGHSDIPLNKTGITQATGAAQSLKNVRFDMAFSSDLLRARRTAEIIAAEHKLAIKTTEAIRERYYGRLEGAPRKEYDEYFLKLKEMAENEHDSYRKSMEIETDESVISRVFTFIRETAVAYPGKTVLMVCHGGLLSQLLYHLGCYEYEYHRRVRVKNTGYVVIETDGPDMKVIKQHGVTLHDMVSLSL